MLETNARSTTQWYGDPLKGKPEIATIPVRVA
jgi:hypothetical protein